HTVKGRRIAWASRMTVSLNCRATLWLAMTALGDASPRHPTPRHRLDCHVSSLRDLPRKDNVGGYARNTGTNNPAKIDF
ncbi:MAG: hypothetical protein O3B25_11620, partial [Verrucomicrobia bacterium]|nr:hypothetical protein [Verrucomicrobiota bacterium]